MDDKQWDLNGIRGVSIDRSLLTGFEEPSYVESVLQLQVLELLSSIKRDQLSLETKRFKFQSK